MNCQQRFRLARIRVTRAVAALIVAALCSAGAPSVAIAGVVFEWSNAVDGNFNDNTKWTLLGGVGSTPGPSDAVIFNEPGPPAYSVTFTAPTFSPLLDFQAGDVTFRSMGVDETYTIVTAQGDAEITGGTLNLGVSGDPLDLVISDRLNVYTGGTLNVEFGSLLDVSANVSVGVGSGTTSTLRIDGAGSTIDVAGNVFLGNTSATGVLSFENGASGTIGGSMRVATEIGTNRTGRLDVLSGSSLQTGNIDVAAPILLVSSGLDGRVRVFGSGSSLTMTGASTLTVGKLGENHVAEVEVFSFGTFTTGTGAINIRNTGLINIVGGTFNANGPVTVDGGTISRSTASNAFNLASGLTLTATGNAQIDFNGSYFINQGTTFDIQSGADFSLTGGLVIGSIGNGTLLVDGAGSSVTTGLSTPVAWGANGNAANVTFGNGATGNLGAILLASSPSTGSTGIFNVESAAVVSIGNLEVARILGATTSGTVTVDGAGSMLTQSGLSVFALGQASTGTATINVTNGGTFSTATGTGQIFSTGTINIGLIGGGTFNANGNLDVLGGTINSTGSGFNLGAGLTLTASNDAQLSFNSATSINENTTFQIESGADLSVTGGLDIGDATGDGTLVVDGAGSTMTSSADLIVGDDGGGTLSILNGGGIDNVNAFIGRNLGATGNATASDIGSVWTNTGSLYVGGSDVAAGGTGTLTVETGATVDVAGTLKIWDAGTVNLNGGTINADTLDQEPAGTFNWTAGTLAVNTINSDVINSGGTLAPGNSPGITTVNGNFTNQLNATVEIELASAAGVAGTDFDLLSVTGLATLDGTLDVVIVNPFVPTHGQTFQAITFGSRSGMFSQVTDSGLSENLVIAPFYTATDLTLSVELLGDGSGDGIVDAADYTTWANGFGTAEANYTSGDYTRDGLVNAADYTTWANHFGQSVMSPVSTAPLGHAALSPSHPLAAVPEPSTLLLLVIGAIALLWRRA